MINKKTTQENLNKIIEFRQAIYEQFFGKRRDALFEAWDAMLVQGALTSFPMLSLNPVFQRKWSSLYKALGKGEIDSGGLEKYLSEMVPQDGVRYYALDGTGWPRPRARTMDDRQYVYLPTSAINGGSVCVGYPYSLLDWVPEPNVSWSLSVSVRRIASYESAKSVGVEQIQALNEARKDSQAVLDIVAGDGKYGNAGFLRPLQGQRCGLVVRLRKDRILYRTPEEPEVRKRGRPKIHGKRFAFKEPETWSGPDEVIELEHVHWGQVRLDRWKGLHGKRDADVPFDIIRASVHLERDKPPKPLWLAWQAPDIVPEGIHLDAAVIWKAYCHRWPIEPNIRFRKQRLGWCKPQFQDKETGDRWSWLVALAVWMLYLARPIVQDHPLPWQKSQIYLTPQRVQQGFPLIFAQFGSPACIPKLRGIPPGWPKGRLRSPKQRFKVVKKQPSPA
ncbi:transposase [Chloroflexota bacterium]